MLNDLKVKASKKMKKPYKLTDGQGLFLQVTPSGEKLWRFKYRFYNKERLLSFGSYPEVSLADARDKRAEARKQVAAVTRSWLWVAGRFFLHLRPPDQEADFLPLADGSEKFRIEFTCRIKSLHLDSFFMHVRKLSRRGREGKGKSEKHKDVVALILGMLSILEGAEKARIF